VLPISAAVVWAGYLSGRPVDGPGCWQMAIACLFATVGSRCAPYSGDNAGRSILPTREMG
jgi:hypothetical protein